MGLILVSVIIALRKLPQIRTLQKKDIVRLIMIGLVGGSLPFYLFFTGLASVPAANAAIVQKVTSGMGSYPCYSIPEREVFHFSVSLRCLYFLSEIIILVDSRGFRFRLVN